jgi:hypothetical protein
VRIQKQFLRVGLILLLACLLAILAAPIAVANGIRFWIWWKARQQHLIVKIDKIEAPLLRPVVLRGIRITSAPDAAFRIEINAADATTALNLKAIFFRAPERALRTLSVNGLRAQIHRNESGIPFPEHSALTWQNLLPGSANLNQAELRIENGPTVILLRGGRISASEIEAGRFSADEITIASPLVRQTFSQLRGATRWQDNHLTLAGFILARGLDVESLTFDLSHLGKERLGVEFDLDAFGGKIRANVSNEWHSRHSNWNMAGSANDISLSQTAEAIGFADRVGGLLHACKFTFRGDLREPSHSVASLWTELTSPAWHDREADLIMLGVALYNQQIQLQQLYVKQKKNQLTLSGEGPLPSTLSDWLRPDFRGDISAAIDDLGEFASLFGANRNDFAGKIAVTGMMNTRDRKVGGHVAAEGTALTVLKIPIDSLSATLDLKGGQLDLEELELAHGQDFLRGQSKIDIGPQHHSAGQFAISVQRISDYVTNPLFPGSLKGEINFTGRNATLDSLQLSEGNAAASFSGTIDLNDLGNIGVILTPGTRLFDLSGSNVQDCLENVHLMAAPKSKQPRPSIDQIELRGDFAAGLRSVKLTTPAGERAYRVLCTDTPNRALPLGVQKE